MVSVMRRSRALLLGAVIAAVLAAVPTTPAAACSCAADTPRNMLEGADAAFVGTLSDQSIGDERSTYTFTVDEAVKGTFADTITITGEGANSSCGGIGADLGQQIGVLLHRWRHGYTTSICSSISAADLLGAVGPLVADADAGPATVLAGGSFGGTRLVALDASGRVAAWAEGRGVTYSVSACPGGRVALEQVTMAPAAGMKGSQFLYLRDLRDLQAHRLRFFSERGMSSVYRVVCGSDDGSTVVVASTRGLFIVRDGPPVRVSRGAVYDAVLDGTTIYAIKERSVIRVDLGSDDVAVDVIGRFDQRRLSIELSQDGRTIALTRDWTAVDGASGILVGRLGSEPVRFTMVPSTTLDGFPTLTILDGAAPDVVYDLTALSSPTEFPPSEPIGQRLDGPTFGPEAPPPRSAIAAAESTVPSWLLVSVAAVMASGLVLIARRRRSRERSP
jgi:hypothetical protein